jgi:hypothetical protein
MLSKAEKGHSAAISRACGDRIMRLNPMRVISLPFSGMATSGELAHVFELFELVEDQ